jgi:hypothetical protein
MHRSAGVRSLAGVGLLLLAGCGGASPARTPEASPAATPTAAGVPATSAAAPPSETPEAASPEAGDLPPCPDPSLVAQYTGYRGPLDYLDRGFCQYQFVPGGVLFYINRSHDTIATRDATRALLGQEVGPLAPGIWIGDNQQGQHEAYGYVDKPGVGITCVDDSNGKSPADATATALKLCVRYLGWVNRQPE